MQSSRALGFVFLLLLVCGGAALWFVYGGRDPGVVPSATATNERDPSVHAVEAAGADGGATAVLPATGAHEGEAQREVVADANRFDGAAIVGRAVDGNGQPLASVEVLCVPGMGFMPDFSSFDAAGGDMFEDPDAFDPQTMMARSERELSERVTTRTDGDGRFRIRAKGTSTVVGLRLLQDGFEVLDRTAKRPEQQDVDLGDLKLLRGAIVSGRVVDARGKPVAGASVAALHDIEKNIPAGFDFQMPGMDKLEEQRIGQTVRSDEAGHFVLRHVQAGEVVLRARHKDFPMLKRGDLQAVAGQELRDVILTMPRAASITGRVAELPADPKGLVVMAAAKPEASATPAAGMMGMFGDMSDMLADAGMLFADRQCELAADGTFELKGLYAERGYRVWVAQQGKGFAGDGLCSERREVTSGSVGVELHYEAGVTVTCTVVAAGTGAPVEQLWVRDRLKGGDRMAEMMSAGVDRSKLRSYPGGKVTVANLRPKKGQKLNLDVNAIGFAAGSRADVELPALGLLDLGVIELEPQPVLHVVVVDGTDGRPVAKAKVRFGGDGMGGQFAMFARGMGASGPDSGTTDAEGRCTLNRPATVSRLTVDSKDFAPFSAEIAASTEREVAFTARLLVGGAAVVTVKDPAGKPVAKVSIEHGAAEGGSTRGTTDAEGIARFAHLAPGSHTFRIAADGGGFAAMFGAGMRARVGEAEPDEAPVEKVEIADRASVEVTLTKASTATLQGLVRENGVPLAGARVSFVEGPGDGTEKPEDVASRAVGDMMSQFGGGAKGRGKTAEDGRYQLAELPPGQHRLRITHKERALPTELPITLREGDNTFDVDLDMTAVRGIVRDVEGNPVDGARVSVLVEREGDAAGDIGGAVAESMSQMMPGMDLGGGSTIKTDASGAFELRGVTPDVTLRIKAVAKGLAPASTTTKVGVGEVKQGIEVRLGRAGRIKVELADAPMFGGVTATWAGDEGENVAPVMQMMRKGKATLEGLRPGRWKVKIEGPGREGAEDEAHEQTVDVVAGETVEVKL